MKNKFILLVTEFFKILGNQTCIVGFVEPEQHSIITSDYVGKIVIDGVEERDLNIMGQDIFARTPGIEPSGKTSIRTLDNLDDLFPLVNIKKIVVTGYLPEK